MPFDHIQERLGTLVGGQYLLLRMIGEGGMGAVFEAERAGTGERVAVKLIKPQFSQSHEVNARFLQEANTVAAIGHPNIVQVLASGSDAEGPFMVLELLDGETLGDVIHRRPLGPREALAVGAEMLDALRAAHAAQVIHRDIKPENIFLVGGADACRGVKLLDFGISKILSAEHGGGLTRTGMAVGTPDYMSPEQASGARIDGRSDLWAVGAVLYESIARVLPFQGENYQQLLARILMTAHTPLVERVPAVTPEVAAIIDRALAKEVSQRWSSADEMLAAVRNVLATLPPDESLGPRDDPTAVVPGEADPTVVRVAPPPSAITEDTPLVHGSLATPIGDDTPVTPGGGTLMDPVRPSFGEDFPHLGTELAAVPIPPRGVSPTPWTGDERMRESLLPLGKAVGQRTRRMVWLSVAVGSGLLVGSLVGITASHHPARVVLRPPTNRPPVARPDAPTPSPVLPPVPPVEQLMAPSVPPSPTAGTSPERIAAVADVPPSTVIVVPPLRHGRTRARSERVPGASTEHGEPLTSIEGMTALHPLLMPLQNCARGVGGNVQARLSVDAQGVVRSVRLEGPFAHTTAASCVSHTLRVARFPPGRPTQALRIAFGLTP